jgi:hypothetical protein
MKESKEIDSFYESILNTPMQDNDADAKTIREYLTKLLLKVWKEGEGFNGKRPFGTSSWEYDIYRALAKGGHVTGMEYDEDGDIAYFSDMQRTRADRMITESILWMGRPE